MSDKTTAALAAEQADTEATTTQEAELLPAATLDELEQVDAYWQIESTFALKLKKALPVTMSDGSQTSLPVGTQLSVTATDAQSVVFFKTGAGSTGSIAIEQAGDGYSWLIGGVSENEYFETLPYAG